MGVRESSLKIAIVLGMAVATTATVMAADLLDEIRALPSVIDANEIQAVVPGTRLFRIGFEQPVDHENPAGDIFSQRVVLIHRSAAAPVVLVTEGYSLPPAGVQRELTTILGANQLDVEHRFFGQSAPDPLGWADLTTAQSAADHHRIIESFKHLYAGKWVSTGNSKSGMASIYHRFYYPDDVDATVAYVAPSSHGTRDGRYVQFLGRVGTSECRGKIQALQLAALQRRHELLPLMPDASFDLLGRERAFEFAVLELPFLFWQWEDESTCNSIPSPDATPTQVMEFIDQVAGFIDYEDDALLEYAPYYYQAATELGGPRIDDCSALSTPRVLREMVFGRSLSAPPALCLSFDDGGQDVPALYPPDGVVKDFDDGMMPRIENWVLTEGRRLLFVYGANDPWSSTAFRVREENDSHVFYVNGPKGNHQASIMSLSDTDRQAVLAHLQAWLGVISAVSLQDATAERLAIERPSRRELYLH